MNNLLGPLSVSGAGVTINIIPFYVKHGEIDALGFKINEKECD